MHYWWHYSFLKSISPMDIGIIGAGELGKALAQHWYKLGHQVMISHPTQDQVPTQPLLPPIRMGSALEAAKFGEIIVLAVGWTGFSQALAEVKKVEAKILVDLSVPFHADAPGRIGGLVASVAEEIALQMPRLHVVKVYSTVTVHWQESLSLEKLPVVFYCGDNALAKAIVARLIRESGLEALDMGPLSMARYIEMLGMLNQTVKQHCRAKGLCISLLQG